MRSVLLPLSWQFWPWKCAWALFLAAIAVWLAARKNRTMIGWPLLSGIAGFIVGSPGLLVILFLLTRKKLSMRMKYLTLKLEEDLAHALKFPSPVGNNLEKRILMVLANNPRGLRLGALAQGVGSDWRHIEDTVQKMLLKGKVRKEGERYFFNLDK